MSDIIRVYNGFEITHRSLDRYIDASAMCLAYGARWRDYERLDGTQRFLEALSRRLGVPVKLGQNPASLIQTREGRGGYILVHPLIGVDLARWLDADFAVQVTIWMEELLTTGKVELARPTAPLPWGQRLDPRVMDFRMRLRLKYPARWSVVAATIDDILALEDVLHQHGYPLSLSDLPDGAFGYHWKIWRQGKPWAGEFIQELELDSGNKTRRGNILWVKPRLYRLDELEHFSRWFTSEYMPEKFPNYLADKAKRDADRWQQQGIAAPLPIVIGRAADAACRRLTGQGAHLPESLAKPARLENQPKQQTLFS